MMRLMRTLKANWRLSLATFVVVCALVCLAVVRTDQVDAYGLNNEGPERKAVLTISYTTYEWWLLTWSDSEPICQVYVEHEGVPQPDEIDFYCGQRVTEDWLDTPPCQFSDQITRAEQCPGLYFHLVNVTPGQREIEVDLLPPSVFIDVAGCELQPPENRCDSMPSLHLIADEPLPNEHIIQIQGYIGAEPFNCEGDDCTVPLPATGLEGTRVSFWGKSSYGDSTEVYTARIRVIPWGDFGAPDDQTFDQPQWYVDIISSQYLGEVKSSCSKIWSAFPPVGGPPSWLASPPHPDGLISSEPFYYLAGSLIRQGLVDVSTCLDGGLEAYGYANQCGLEAARPQIDEWQNLFNSEIIQVATDTGIPAQLLKNIFGRESQFWPGLSQNYYEAGLGHLSDLGADTVLLWNPSFFSQFCPLVLETTRCQKGFGNLDIAEQEMLRGALVQKVNAACPDCPEGIDLRQANFSISIFARSLLANCEQVGQIIYNQTQQQAGEVSNYEDLWRFTLVNYNGGAGCLNNAIKLALDSNYTLTWENVIQFIEPGVCQESIDYVEDISHMPPTPTATPVVPLQTPTPDLTTTPTPTSTAASSLSPTPTPTY